MQASVHTVTDTLAGTALLDDGRVVEFAGQVVADSGLLHVRPGQRITIALDEATWTITKMWVVGIGEGQPLR
jgi:2-phospho-L-lactate guanylyltransferase